MGPVEVTVTPDSQVRNCKINGSYTQVVILDDTNKMTKQLHLRAVGKKNLKVQDRTRYNLQPYRNNVDLPALFDVSVTGSPGDTGILCLEVYFSKSSANARHAVSNSQAFNQIRVIFQIR